MQRGLRTLLIGALALSAASSVLAVGSGSGGSIPQQPSCSADTWSCSDWSSCSASGRETRTCTLTFDCPGAETPKPPEERSCTPPSSSTPAPQSCSEDRFECGAWSSTCTVDGVEERTCRKVFDCPGVETSPPETQRPCSHLQCGRKATLRERIRCRLDLSPSGIARELELEYLPEECRALADRSDRDACIARYRSYQPCWSIPAGSERFACARNVLKLGPVVADEMRACKGKTGAAEVSCKRDVREKVFAMIKFRFYDLEERAEELARRGAPLDAVADLETTIEEKKQAFTAARTKEERRQIILDVRRAWREFVEKVKDEVR